MDSKLVVREKRASRGDLPSQLLCLASVTSLALLLVWLRMSSVNRTQFSLRLLTCHWLTYSKGPDSDLLYHYSLVSCQLDINLVITGKQIGINIFNRLTDCQFSKLPQAFIVITTNINIFVIRVLVILTIIFPDERVTITGKFFAHRHYLPERWVLTRPCYPASEQHTDSLLSVQHSACTLSLGWAALHTKLETDHLTDGYLNIQPQYEMFVLSITSFLEKLWQDWQKPRSPHWSRLSLFSFSPWWVRAAARGPPAGPCELGNVSCD